MLLYFIISELYHSDSCGQKNVTVMLSAKGNCDLQLPNNNRSFCYFCDFKKLYVSFGKWEVILI